MASYETYQDCLAAVQQNGLAISRIPLEFCTPELCLAAVQQNADALLHIDVERWFYGFDGPDFVPGLCLASVQKTLGAFTWICDDGARLLAEEVLESSGSLEAVPEHLLRVVASKLGLMVA